MNVSTRALVLAGALAAARIVAPVRARAQHAAGHAPARDTSAMVMSGLLGIPDARGGSGTSWLPDDAPMHAVHRAAGRWTFMLHGAAFVYWDDMGSRRGASQVGSIDWGMVMASHPVGAGQLQLRGMVSAEPWTVGAHGYPLLLQSGETFHGAPLHDRQHPHDLFMELAALVQEPVTRSLGVELYAAPAGEPALGPPAFPHRPSAWSDPLAPIGHHWQDATHISFGVITAGVFSHRVKLEGSIFNGREPDEVRTNLDWHGRRLDSYAGRLTINPGAAWSVQASYGFLASPEALEPGVSVHRLTASVLTSRPAGRAFWSSALIYGANRPSSGGTEPSVLLESTLDGARGALFGRVEWVRKTAGELVIPALPMDSALAVAELSLGGERRVARVAGLDVALGALGMVGRVPASLRASYGTRTPAGVALFLHLAPPAMSRAMPMAPMPGMGDMPGMPGAPR